jgi:predicted ester cyclase
LGTNDGELMGMPPSGRAVRLDVIHVDTVKDGLIHDEFAVLDRAALMERLQAT